MRGFHFLDPLGGLGTQQQLMLEGTAGTPSVGLEALCHFISCSSTRQRGSLPSSVEA